MKSSSRGRLIAAAALLAVAVLLPGRAAADGPAFTVENVTVAEAGGAVELTVKLAAAAEADEVLNWATAAGSASAGADYTEEAGQVTIAAGADEAKLDVAILQDALDEADEAFTVNVTHSSGAPAVTATATITDDDAPPSVSVAPPAAAVQEGEVASFPVTLSSASGRPVQVSYQTVPATSGRFVGTTTGSIVIPAGETTGAIAVQTNENEASDGNVAFAVVLNPCGATCTLGSPTQATATIEDDEGAPTASIADTSVVEGARNTDTGNVELSFTLSLSGASGQPVSVTALTQDGTAVAPSDYQQKSQPFTFAPGETSKTFVVVVNDDLLDEPGETVVVVLLNGAGAEIDRAEGTISDDDNTSLLSVSDASVDEPSSGTATLTFAVTLAPASARTVSVGWATGDGTAAAGSDYTAASGSLTFAPGGPTTQSVTVQVLGDTLNEENETVRLTLAGAAGAAVADAEGLGTIVDKNAPPTLAVSDPTGREGSGATFTIELLGTTLRTVTVGFSTSDGSARAGLDYLARVGTLSFAPGEKTKTVAVTIVDDAAVEPAETFSLGLGNPTNAAISKSRGTATIEASDSVAATPSGTPRPTTPTTPRPTTRALPRMTLGPRVVAVSRAGVARMTVRCAKASPLTCAGSVSLETTVKPKHKLGTKKFTARKGKRVTVAIKLSARGLKLLRQRGTIRARAVVLVRAGKQTLRVVPGVVTLKAAPKPKKKGVSRR
ncbi:MAG TPA: Calx-beta domain-containing protein [Gaiellaceae bacterium]|nr:Calx-beta domain-containing protein [Gaiellaceae bacterium]